MAWLQGVSLAWLQGIQRLGARGMWRNERENVVPFLICIA